MAEDSFLEALTALEGTLADNQERTSQIRTRIAQLRRLRSQGASYTELVATSDGPLIVRSPWPSMPIGSLMMKSSPAMPVITT